MVDYTAACRSKKKPGDVAAAGFAKRGTDAHMGRAPVMTPVADESGYFECITLMSAMWPGPWQTMQVSTLPSATLRGE